MRWLVRAHKHTHTHTHRGRHTQRHTCLPKYTVMQQITEEMEVIFAARLSMYISQQRAMKCMKCHCSPDLCIEVGVCMSGQCLPPELRRDIHTVFQRLRGLLGLPTNPYFQISGCAVAKQLKTFGY